MVEDEQAVHETGLIDAYFEEAQYDAAIATLEQLCSSTVKPTAAHIRQLLYIALYPPTTQKETKFWDPLASPSKVKVTKNNTQSPLTMSYKTTVAAQRLLISLAFTNSPAAVFRVVPYYGQENIPNPRANSDGDVFDAVIAYESLCITDCRSCWKFIEEDFVQRFISGPAPAVRNRRTSRAVSASFDDDSAEPKMPKLVGENAWPVLEWLLTIFERDEQFTEAADIPRHSPLLLSQLPLPRGTKEARWEVDAPLDIALFALSFDDCERKMMGTRLLTLVVNLTSTIFIDFPMFLGSVFSRLSTLPFNHVVDILNSMTPSAVILKFRIAIYQKFKVTAGTESRPRPRARAQPKAAKPTTSDVSPPPPAQETPASKFSRHIAPTSAVLLQLLETESKESYNSNLCFELLASYAAYQSSYAGTDMDPDWPNLKDDRRLRVTMDKLFGKDDNSRIYLEILNNIFGAPTQAIP